MEESLTLCWHCLKPMEDKGAAMQWCSPKCQRLWEERDEALAESKADVTNGG